jgi:hypothetical protein
LNTSDVAYLLDTWLFRCNDATMRRQPLEPPATQPTAAFMKGSWPTSERATISLDCSMESVQATLTADGLPRIRIPFRLLRVSSSHLTTSPLSYQSLKSLTYYRQSKKHGHSSQVCNSSGAAGCSKAKSLTPFLKLLHYGLRYPSLPNTMFPRPRTDYQISKMMSMPCYSNCGGYENYLLRGRIYRTRYIS